MESGLRQKPLLFTVPLSLLIAAASLGGLFISGMYSRETAFAAAQALAQDVIDLIIVVPTLLISSVLIRKGSKYSYFIWLGAMMYVAYTFVIYCFGVHFNDLFLVYCFTLGLSFYSITTILASTDSHAVMSWFDEKKSNNVVIAYLWIIALLFSAQWLKEIIPAMINNDVPQSVKDAGAFTSAVHVLDLSIFLPGFFVAAVLLRKRHPIGYLIAPSFVVFGMLTAVAIGAMVVSMRFSGLNVDETSLLVFVGLAAISVVVMVEFLNHIKSEPRAVPS